MGNRTDLACCRRPETRVGARESSDPRRHAPAQRSFADASDPDMRVLRMRVRRESSVSRERFIFEACFTPVERLSRVTAL